MAEQLNVDQAVESGLDAAIGGTSGLGAPTQTATAGTPPIPGSGNPMQGANTQTGRGFGAPTLNQPDWAWRPTQDDFGQVDVRRGQYDTGMVPTVNVQHAFPALANRQEALAQRKAALADKVANFDRYAGLGSAPDPYLTNFGNLARGGMDQFVKDIASSMYGGDQNAATRAIMESPELMAQFKNKAAAYNEIGQRAQGWFDGAETFLREVESNQRSADPETIALARQMVNGIGNFGTEGAPDVEKLAEMGQMLESRLSAEEAFKQLVPGLEKAMVTERGPATIRRGPGGKLIVQSTTKKGFDDLIDTAAGQFVAQGIFPTKAQAKEYLDGRLGHEEVTETKLESINYAPEYMMGGGSAPQDRAAMATASVVSKKGSGSYDSPFVPKGSMPSFTTREGALTISPKMMVGKKEVPVPKAVIYAANGDPENVAFPTPIYNPVKQGWFIEGRSLTDKDVSAYDEITKNFNESMSSAIGDGGSIDSEAVRGYMEKIGSISSKGQAVEYPAYQNEEAMMQLIGYRTPQEWVIARLSAVDPEYNIDPQTLNTLMKDEKTRKLIEDKLSGK